MRMEKTRAEICFLHNISPALISKYEAEGIIKVEVARKSCKKHVYTEETEEQISKVVFYRMLGYGIEEIKQGIPINETIKKLCELEQKIERFKKTLALT